MRSTLILFSVLFSLGMIQWSHAQAKPSKNQQNEFIVLGNCEMCQKRIEKAALTVKGVKMAQWDIPSNILQVVYNAQKIELQQIHQAVAAVGHDTDSHQAPDGVYAALPLCCLYDRKDYN
ncbi:MAG: heavy-metal-associated domain-containing protein [Flavobacteriaceae bacterium]